MKKRRIETSSGGSSRERGPPTAQSPRRASRRLARAARLALLVTVVLPTFAAGCASWRGARLYHSGTVALQRGDVPRALTDLEAASELVPEASEIHNNLGLAQLEAGQERLALQSFERATQLDCTNAAASENLRGLEARLRRSERRVAISSVSREPPRRINSSIADGPGNPAAELEDTEPARASRDRSNLLSTPQRSQPSREEGP